MAKKQGQSTTTSPTIMARVAVALFWLGAWQVTSMAVGSEILLPSPLATLCALEKLVPTTEFWKIIASSAGRIARGVLAGYILALALAGVAHVHGGARLLLKPALATIKGTPLVCIVVLLLIWFGPAHVTAWAVFLLVLPSMYFPTLEALDIADARRRELFDALGADGVTKLLGFAWPAVLSPVAGASQNALGMSWKAGVAAELIGMPTRSIGEQVYQAKVLLETADLFAWTIVIVALSWLFERCCLALVRSSWPLLGRWAAKRSRGPRVRRQECNDAQAPCAPCGIICITGPSGAGKTTLLRHMAGLPTHLCEPLDARSPLPAALENMPVAPVAKGASRSSSWVFQDTRLVEELSAIDNITLFCGCTQRDAACELLRELGLAGCTERPVEELSGGQRRRVELVRALLTPSDLLLLDEPFTGLDIRARKASIAAIAEYRHDRPTLLATHDPTDAEALGAQLVTLESHAHPAELDSPHCPSLRNH